MLLSQASLLTAGGGSPSSVSVPSAGAISNQDRAAATAGHRAMNLTAVPVGFLLGGMHDDRRRGLRSDHVKAEPDSAIVTKRLVLSRIARDDADELVAMLLNPAFYHHIGDAPASAAEAGDRVERWLQLADGSGPDRFDDEFVITMVANSTNHDTDRSAARDRLRHLSAREIQVATAVADGESNAEIAADLTLTIPAASL